MDAVRARWSSSSFLLYAGAFVVLFAAVALLAWLASEHSDGAFFGWAALVFAVVAVVAIGFEAAGERVTAGLFAFVSLIMFSVWIGSFEDLIGILDDTSAGPFDGFRWGLLLFDLIVITASLILLARFQFPLLVLPAVFMSWFFVVDLVSGGGNWSAVVSIVVGFFLMLVGAGVDRIYGFWVHFVAALAIGGGFIYLWRGSGVGVDPHRPDRAPVLRPRGRLRPLDLRRPRRDRPLPRLVVLRPTVDGRRGFESDQRRARAVRLHVGQRRAQRVGRRHAVRALRPRARRDRPLARTAQAVRARRAFQPVAATYNSRRAEGAENRSAGRAGRLSRARGHAAWARRRRGRGAQAERAGGPRRARRPRR